jgi:sarcosine oxidase gamma subunit
MHIRATSPNGSGRPHWIASACAIPPSLSHRTPSPDKRAVTTVAHIDAHFWQVDETPIYEFIISRSFAAAFGHWLLASAAEFGVVVVQGGN